MSVRVVLEVAPKRAFASALDWPGWSRGAKTAGAALEALLAYGPRYAPVARRAKVAFRVPATIRVFDVVERLTGGGGTEFGVPSAVAGSEGDPLTPTELKRMVALLEASWKSFDAAARKAEGVQLRVGPRGGGRQVPKIIEHVAEAEVAYLGQLGSQAPDASGRDAGPGDGPSDAAAMRLVRAAFVATVIARATGNPLADPNRVRRPWSPRYAVRRSAWHALDHAWEIEDRSGV